MVTVWGGASHVSREDQRVVDELRDSMRPREIVVAVCLRARPFAGAARRRGAGGGVLARPRTAESFLCFAFPMTLEGSR